MNCLFCFKEVKSVRSVTSDCRFTCAACGTHFVFTLEKQLLIVTLYYENFACQFWINDRRFYLIDLKEVNNSPVILMLDFLPNITPPNVHSKIKTILTFS